MDQVSELMTLEDLERMKGLTVGKLNNFTATDGQMEGKERGERS